MQKVTINPSIAAIVNIDPIGKDEIVPIYFTADENWAGTYEVKVWNSDKKNTELEVPETITVDDDEINTLDVTDAIMTLTIAPSEQTMTANKYYYEITHVEASRVVFKGDLNIIK